MLARAPVSDAALPIAGSLTIVAALAWAWTVASADMPTCHGLGLLPFLDRELAGILAQQMQDVGVRLLFGRKTKSIAIEDDKGVCVALDDGDELRLTAEHVRLLVGFHDVAISDRPAGTSL